MTPDEAYRDAIRRWNEADQRVEAARQERQQAHRDLNAALLDMFSPDRADAEPEPERTRRYRNRGIVRSAWVDGLV